MPKCPPGTENTSPKLKSSNKGAFQCLSKTLLPTHKKNRDHLLLGEWAGTEDREKGKQKTDTCLSDSSNWTLKPVLIMGRSISCSNSTDAGWLRGCGLCLNGAEGSLWVPLLRALSCSKWINLTEEQGSVSVTSHDGWLCTFCPTRSKVLLPLNLSPDDSACCTLFLATGKRKIQHPGVFFVGQGWLAPGTSHKHFQSTVFYLVLNLSLCFSTLAYYYCLLCACFFHQTVSFSSKRLCIFLCVILYLTPSAGHPSVWNSTGTDLIIAEWVNIWKPLLLAGTSW